MSSLDAPVREISLRRRFDNGVLRWQARLDSENTDRFLPWVWAIVLFLILASLSLARARSLIDGVDLGTYTQASWLIGEGLEPKTSVSGGRHVLNMQASFAFYPLAWSTDYFPRIATLLIGQSAALAVAVVPIWRIARNEALLRTGAAATLLFAYSLFPAVHNLNVSDFHPEVLGIPALLWAIRFSLSRQWIGFGLMSVVAVLARADLSLGIVGLGMLLIFEKHRLVGAITTAVASIYVLVAVALIQPEFGDGETAHVDSFQAFGDSPLGIAQGFLTNPGTLFADLTVEANFGVFVFLFAPLFFLPVLAPRYLLPVVPLQCLYLIADVPIEDTFGPQTVAITAFLFVATAFALKRLGRMGVERIKVDGRMLAALILAATVFFISSAETSPYREPWTWGGRSESDQARLEAVDLVGPTESVRASPELTPILAERTELFVLDTLERPDVRATTEIPGEDLDKSPDDRRLVDVVIVDRESEVAWSDDELRVFREGLARLGYVQEFSAESIEFYRFVEAEENGI